MKISKRISNMTELELKYAKQLGATHIIGHIPDDGDQTKWDFINLLQLRKFVELQGLEWAAIGSPPASVMQEVMLASARREEAIDRICSYILNMGKAGIPILGYTFSLLPCWGRWRSGLQGGGRGGAGIMSFDFELVEHAPLTEFGVIASDLMWERLIYFLKRVLPVAEDAGVKLACHPDDPPAPELRDIARIQTNVADFKRLVEAVPSPSNRLTFCVGTVAETGGDVINAIKYFGARRQISVVHFRNVRRLSKDILNYDEAFIDNGDLDMLEVLRTLAEVEYDGLLDPDHAPVLETDSQWGRQRGYAHAYGYIAGLRDCLKADA